MISSTTTESVRSDADGTTDDENEQVVVDDEQSDCGNNVVAQAPNRDDEDDDDEDKLEIDIQSDDDRDATTSTAARTHGDERTVAMMRQRLLGKQLSVDRHKFVSSQLAMRAAAVWPTVMATPPRRCHSAAAVTGANAHMMDSGVALRDDMARRCVTPDTATHAQSLTPSLARLSGACSTSTVTSPNSSASMPPVVGAAQSAANRQSSLQSLYLTGGASVHECTECGQTFARASQLHIHRSAHQFDTSKRYSHACVVCGASLRSRPLLARHMRHLHADVPESVWAHSYSVSVNRTSANMITPTAASLTRDPRPFHCSDCDTAFRIHGHLSKHLRSKIHVLRLEALGKLPNGVYARIEALSASGDTLEIDTTSCQSALIGLRTLADRMGVTAASVSPDVKPSMAAVDNLALVSKAVRHPSLLKQTAVEIPDSDLSRFDGAHGGTPRKTHSMHAQQAKSIVAKAVWTPPVTVAHTTAPSSDAFRSKPKRTSGDSLTDSMSNGSSTKRERSTVVAPMITLSSHEDKERQGTLLSAMLIRLAASPFHPLSPNHLHVAMGASAAHQPAQSPATCRMCHAAFESAQALDIHLHCDHITMRDGKDLRCPRPNCDRVYPSRENLRAHLLAHYTMPMQLMMTQTTSSSFGSFGMLVSIPSHRG